jgi:DNA-binding transcriptional regulator YdaS (Cro superfamily)
VSGSVLQAFGGGFHGCDYSSRDNHVGVAQTITFVFNGRMSADALDRACEIAGSATSLAARIGTVQSSISNWRARGRVPAEWCVAIERETAGAVTVEELRPDVDWAVIRGKPAVPGREAA